MEDELDALYRRRVGERIRVIRRQQRLSLHDVEDRSESEFKASVLGAYERGERAISVPRLQRLARFYGVPVDQLLPAEAESESGTSNQKNAGWIPGPEAEMIERYLTIIQVKRQDFNGRVLTIRGDDLQALAAILGTDVEAAAPRLDELGLLYRPDAA